MAKMGLSKPYYAKYAFSNGEVTYSGGKVLAKAVDVELELNDSDPAVFYADNGPAESGSIFSGGTLTLTVDTLRPDVTADILGLTLGQDQITVEYAPDNVVPYVGVGIIIKESVGNVPQYRAVILYKVQFNVPGIEATTQGEEIEFSGHELTANVMRADSGSWRAEHVETTETAAETWIKGVFNIT